MRQDQASTTAYWVLQRLLHLAGEPRYAGLVPPDTVAAGYEILGASRRGRRFLLLLRRPVLRRLTPLFERLFIPGLALHYALRKRFVEASARAALDAGVAQVVSVGAGFDPLILRLHADHPEVAFVEIDHPATSRAKQEAVAARLAGARNLALRGADLAEEPLARALADTPGIAVGRSTLFICEGVLPYLPPAEVGRLLVEMRQFGGAGGARLVATAVEPVTEVGPLLRPYLALRGEPVDWRIARDGVEGFLSRHGFALRETATPEALRDRYLGPGAQGPLHTGEYGFVAEALPAG